MKTMLRIEIPLKGLLSQVVSYQTLHASFNAREVLEFQSHSDQGGHALWKYMRVIIHCEEQLEV